MKACIYSCMYLRMYQSIITVTALFHPISNKPFPSEFKYGPLSIRAINLYQIYVVTKDFQFIQLNKFAYQLRVGFSKLYFQKFKHNFRDTMNLVCPMNDGIEHTEQFLLLHPSFDIQRRDLLDEDSDMPRPFAQIDTL